MWKIKVYTTSQGGFYNITDTLANIFQIHEILLCIIYYPYSQILRNLQILRKMSWLLLSLHSGGSMSIKVLTQTKLTQKTVQIIVSGWDRETCKEPKHYWPFTRRLLTSGQEVKLKSYSLGSCHFSVICKFLNHGWTFYSFIFYWKLELLLTRAVNSQTVIINSWSSYGLQWHRNCSHVSFCVVCEVLK